MDRSRIAFLIPAYNEAKTVQIVVQSLIKYGAVFVADDNSTDETALISRDSGASIITNGSERGYENNLNYSFNAIASMNSFDYIITVDADGQHDAKYISDFLDIIFNKSPDIIIAQRTNLPRISEKIFSVITNLLFNLNDVFSGLKAYKLDSFIIDNFDDKKLLGSNLLNIALAKNYRLESFPIIANDRSDANARIGGKIRGNILASLSALRFIYYYAKRKYQ